MEGIFDLGADAQELSGVWSVERQEGCRGNWRDPPRPRPVGAGARLPITGNGKWHGGREGVGWGRGSDDGRDNTTRSERRAPASPVHEKEVRNADECRAIG
jgi:hypothetical protein